MSKNINQEEFLKKSILEVFEKIQKEIDDFDVSIIENFDINKSNDNKSNE